MVPVSVKYLLDLKLVDTWIWEPQQIQNFYMEDVFCLVIGLILLILEQLFKIKAYVTFSVFSCTFEALPLCLLYYKENMVEEISLIPWELLLEYKTNILSRETLEFGIGLALVFTMSEKIFNFPENILKTWEWKLCVVSVYSSYVIIKVFFPSSHMKLPHCFPLIFWKLK